MFASLVSSNGEKNWSILSLIHTRPMNRLTMQKLNKLVYCHYNLKLRNRTRESTTRDDSTYCLIHLDHIFRADDPSLPWLAEIKDLSLDSNPGFQQTIQRLIDEKMSEVATEGQPPQGEGTSTSAHRSGKEPAHIMNFWDTTKVDIMNFFKEFQQRAKLSNIGTSFIALNPRKMEPIMSKISDQSA